MTGAQLAAPVRPEPRRRHRRRRRDRQEARRRWHDNILDAVVVNKKWKALPLGQHRPARGVSHRLVQGSRRHQVPRHLGGPARRRPPAQEEGPSRSASSSATASATTTAGSTRCSGRTAGARSTRTARPSSSTPTRRRRRSTSAGAFYKETMFEDVLGWTDVNNNKAFFGEQISCTNNASSILVVGKRDFPDIAKVTDHGAQPAGAQGPLPPPQPAVPRDPDARPGPGGGQGLPALALRRQAALALARLRRRLLRAVPAAATTTTRCGTPSRATCRTRSRSRPRGCTGGRARRATRRRRAWPSTCVVDMFAKACRGDVDQGRHRHGGGPAQADLQSEVARWRSGPRRRPARPGRGPAAAAARPPRARGRLQLADAGARASSSCSRSSPTRSSTASS